MLSLAQCSRPGEYPKKFTKLVDNLEGLTGKVTMDPSYLIYRFHVGLGPRYEDYRNQCMMSYDVHNGDCNVKESLRFAVARFMSFAEGNGDLWETYPL